MNPLWRGRVTKVGVLVRYIESALNPRAKNIFIIPDNHTLPSGGNVYNRFLVAALKKIGLEVRALPLAEVNKGLRSMENSIFWIDTLCVEIIDLLCNERESNEGIYLIVHHLDSLELDLNGEAYKHEIEREQKVFDKVSGFLVTSPFTEDVLRKRGITEKPIFVVPPALSVLPSKKKKVEDFLAIMVANLIPRKGVLEFLEILGKRVTEEDKFRVRVVGRFDIDPPYSQSCFSVVAGNSVLKNSVQFRGPLSLSSLKRAYENSSVFISSSKMETYGMALQEARAFGLPILAFDAGFVEAHIKPGKNGQVYESIDKLCDACVMFIREPEKLSRLQESTRKLADITRYTWDDAARRLLKQLRELRG